MRPRAALVLVATPIGNLSDLSPRAAEELRRADVVACEDTRRTRKLLTHAGIPGGDRLVAVHDHNEAQMAPRLVAAVADGKRVAYVSDAGTPGVADPGERLVRACLAAGLPVEAVPGPSAVITALVLSGLPGERFAFEGFLPRKGKARSERLDALRREGRTTVIFESPHRVADTLAELAGALGAERPVAVARELTKLHEDVWRGPLGEAAAAVGNPKGEYVVVVGPAAPAAAAEASDVEEAVREQLAQGVSARDAAAAVSDLLGVPKRQAYAVATRLKEG